MDCIEAPRSLLDDAGNTTSDAGCPPIPFQVEYVVTFLKVDPLLLLQETTFLTHLCQR